MRAWSAPSCHLLDSSKPLRTSRSYETNNMLHRHHIVPIIQVSLRWRQHISTGVTLSRLHTESVIIGQLSEAALLCVLWFLKNHIPSLWFRVTEFLRNPASTCHAVLSFIGINNQNKPLVIQETKNHNTVRQKQVFTTLRTNIHQCTIQNTVLSS